MTSENIEEATPKETLKELRSALLDIEEELKVLKSETDIIGQLRKEGHSEKEVELAILFMDGVLPLIFKIVKLDLIQKDSEDLSRKLDSVVKFIEVNKFSESNIDFKSAKHMVTSLEGLLKKYSKRIVKKADEN